MIDPLPDRRHAWSALPALLVLVLVVSPPLSPDLAALAAVRAQEQTNGGTAALEAARSALAEGSADPIQLGMHARTLLEAGDLDTLRLHLTGTRVPVLQAVLAALATSDRVALVDEVLALAAAPPDATLARTALADLRRMVCRDPVERSRLAAELAAGDRSPEQLGVVIDTLGHCRDLAVMDVLIAQLDGPLAERADAALRDLTGHDPQAAVGDEGWAGFWATHRSKSREELLELALSESRSRRRLELEQRSEQLRKLRVEVEQSRIQTMGRELDRLVTRLTDDYPAVRRVAAERLGEHDELERAAALALPTLLARLGANTPEVQDAGSPDVERDPEVRAAIVFAVGALGRGRADVVDVLLAQLDADTDAVAGAAVKGLARVRDQPRIVRPLLDFADRRGARGEELTGLLTIVAANRPAGVLDELSALLDGAVEPGLQAQAIRAVLASEDIVAALELVADRASSPDMTVRYALAAGLRDRLVGLPEGAAGREAILVLLTDLVDDLEPSVRAEAITSLGESRDPSVLSALEARALDEKDATVAGRIVRALGALADPDGIDTVGRLCAARAPGDPILEDGRRAMFSIGAGLDAEGWWMMAGTLDQVRAYELAAMCLQEIITPTRETLVPDPNTVDRARGRLAEVYAEAGRAQEAHALLVALHAAGAPHPQVEARLRLLADAARELQHPEDEAVHLRELRDLLPEGDRRLPDLDRRLAQALWDARLYDEALVEVQALHDAAPDDNGTMLWLGRAQMAVGDDEEARELFDRLLERIPSEDDALRDEVLAARAELGQGDPGEPEPPAEVAGGDEPAQAVTADGTDGR